MSENGLAVVVAVAAVVVAGVADDDAGGGEGLGTVVEVAVEVVVACDASY